MRPSGQGQRSSISLHLKSSRVPCSDPRNWAKEQDSTGGEGRDDCECALGTVTQAYFLNSAESSGTLGKPWLLPIQL